MGKCGTDKQLYWEQPKEMALKMFLDLFVYSLAIEKNIKSKIDTVWVESKDQHSGVCRGAAGTLRKEKLHHIALSMFRPRGRDCLC